jgi:hypothetical protein
VRRLTESDHGGATGPPPCGFDSHRIARQSTWQVRVKQDGIGSRGIWIMPLMIVAGKRYVES